MDGDQDVAVKCIGIFNDTQLQLFENTRDGVLVPHSTIALPADTELVSVDLNQDGRLDLVQVHTVNTFNAELFTLTQSNTFTFIPRTLPLSFPSSHLCAGDLDGSNGPDFVLSDDILDLAVVRIREEGLSAGISIVSVADDGSFTYLGDLILGLDDDVAYSIFLDSRDHVYVTGKAGEPSGSSEFPTTNNAYDISYNGTHDIIVSKLDGDLLVRKIIIVPLIIPILLE